VKYNFSMGKLPKFLIIVVLLITCVSLEYCVHYVLGIHIVYTHLFYIPVVLASLWWGLKGGLPVSLFLGFLHIVFHLPNIELSVLFRAALFIFVGFVVGATSNKLKQAEKKLQKREELKAIFRSAGGGIRAISLDYKIIDQNKEMDTLCDVKKTKAVGKKCSEIFRGFHCGTDKCTLRQVLSGVERVEVEMERIAKGGKTVWVNLIATPLKDEKGKTVGVIESFIDITERKKAEDALQESEGRLKTILETSQVGIAIIDAETHKIIDINPKALEMVDASKEQVVGHICHKHICPAEKGRCPITDLGQTIDRSERVLLKISGEEIPILKSVIPVTLNGHKCLLESFMDITERKKAEERIEHLNKVLSTIGKVNALMVKENNPQKLLKKACKIFAGSREYKSAGAILLENNKSIFQTVACKPGYEDKKLALVDSVKKFTPCIKKALKEKTAVIARRKGVEPLCAGCTFPEKQRCPEKVVIPLSYKEKVFGALLVGSDMPQVLDAEEVKLLKELCEDIGFALESMERKKKREQAEEDLKERFLKLTALSKASVDIGSTLEMGGTLNVSLESALKLLEAKSGSIMLLDEKEKLLTVAASHGLSKEFAEVKEKLGEGIAGYVAKTGEPLLLKEDMKNTRFEKYKKKRKIKDALSIPIKAKDKVIGVFNVDNKEQGTFIPNDLKLFTILASEVGTAIENARLYGDIKQGLLNTVEALAVAVDAKDPYTQGHSDRVTGYSLLIAEEMGLPKKEIEEIKIAARLHDVGKIGISGKVLAKPAPLTDKEWKTVKTHPATSAKILEPVDFPPNIVSCVLSHHERPDGKGYPNGLPKDKIPLGASIIKVADAFDAMTSDRPYRKALPEEKAISELKKYKGIQFHPKVVEAFLRVYEKIK